MVRLDGKFKGDISASETLVVGETGRIEARICADVVIISGTVRGNIEAKSRLEIHKPGALYGDVSTRSLIVDEGAILNGMCRMGEEKKAGEIQTLTFKAGKASSPEAKDSTAKPSDAS
jgi:cytoskeletal protein CcmA (bactofilin family)